MLLPIAFLTIATALIGIASVRRAYLRLHSPAKINEFLKVQRPVRSDGYHNLVSIFQAVSLADEIRMNIAPDGRFYDLLVSDHPDVPKDERNLVLKALNEFRLATGNTQFFNVEIKKRIPLGAGLGGGSSNAATALFGANQLTNAGLTSEALAEIGNRIGSDVAFFLSSTGRALCEGRGEIVHSLNTEHNTEICRKQLVLVLLPWIHCSTGPVFRTFSTLQKAEGGGYTSLNDLELAAAALHPEMAEVKTFLTEEGRLEQATMSGSGSSFFGFLDVEKLADLKEKMKAKFPKAEIHVVERIGKSTKGWYDVKTEEDFSANHQVSKIS